MAQNKRKSSDKGKTPPAKKSKTATPKSTKAKTPAKKATPKTPAKSTKKPAPKITSTKVKKPEPKKTTKTPVKTPARTASKTPARTAAKTPAKPAAKTPAKPAAKTPAKPAAKTPAKPAAKTPAKPAAKTPAKPVAKVAPAKPVLAAKRSTAANVTRAKLDKAKAIKAIAAKSKLKATKAQQKRTTAPVKVPPKEAPASKEKAISKEKPTPKETPAPKEKQTPKADASKKRKADDVAESEPSRKRRVVTPSRKYDDFEVDIPSSTKRTITPNKKYADYETEAPPSTGNRKVSELRAFIIDKKAKPEDKKTEAKATPKASGSAKKPAKAKAASPVENEEDSSESESEDKPTVFKQSEMKPAEKLMKKLQKKLEKEAKAVSVSSPESREKAKIKITKVVEYNKTASTDDAEMKKLAKKVAATKAPSKPRQAVAKTPADETNSRAPKAKATPKQGSKGATKNAAEKVVKPKKFKEIKREERPIQAQFLCQKTIKLNSDNKEGKCWITGIDVYPSGEIILIDMANKKIKLFSAEFQYLSQCQLDTIPQDISVSPVDVSCAYFTKPFSKEGIQKVIMSDGKLTLKEFFTTNGTNRGIACMKTGILTSVQDGRYHDVDINHFKIYLLDYSGNMLQSVSTDTNGSRLFKLPLYFTVSSTGKQVIVSDCIKQNSYVVSVDMTGKIYFKYEGFGGDNLITPRGITSDDEDNIYVTEWEKNTIYILNSAGKRTQTLFNHKELLQDKLDGLVKPYQLCFYKTDAKKQLIVSQESCDTLKVFRILKKEEAETEAKAKAEEAAIKKPVENGEAEKATPEVPEGEKEQTPVEVSKPIESPVKVLKETGSPVIIKKPEMISVATASKEVSAKPKVEFVSMATVSKESPMKPKVIQIKKQVPVQTGQQKKVEVIVAPRSAVGVKPMVQVIDKRGSTAAHASASIVKTVVSASPYARVSQTTQQTIVEVIAPPTVLQAVQEVKKDEIFDNPEDDFDDDTEQVDSEMNGKLEDLVSAFDNEAGAVENVPVLQVNEMSPDIPVIEEELTEAPEEEELTEALEEEIIEPVQEIPVAEVEATEIPQVTTEVHQQFTEAPQQMTEIHQVVSEPQVSIIQDGEPVSIIQDGEPMEQVTYVQTMQETVEPMEIELGGMGDAGIEQTVEEVHVPVSEMHQIITTSGENLYQSVEGVVMDTGAVVDNSVMNFAVGEHDVVETSVITEGGVEYQEVVTDVPHELDTIATEFVV